MAAIQAPDGIYQTLTAAEASRLFPVTPATIRKWVQLGKLKAVDADASGRKLYRLIDIAECELSTREKSGRARRLGLA